MANINFEAFLMAVRASNALDRVEHEHRFTEHYQQAIATSGHEYAEALARSEVLHILLRAEISFEGAAYLKSHLR